MLPAQAGVIPTSGFCFEEALNAPRAGGGDPDIETLEEMLTLCSPRRRG